MVKKDQNLQQISELTIQQELDDNTQQPLS